MGSAVLVYPSKGNLALGEQETEWQDHAECRGVDPALFFPESQSAEAVDPPKAVCARCPVRRECLDFAMATGQHDGVWGGLDEKERRKLRVRRANGG